MAVNNFRVTFGGDEIDYRSNFADCRKYYPILRELMNHLEHDFDVEAAWWFFEPYAEVTWIVKDGKDGVSILKEVERSLQRREIEYKVFTPEDGQFADWYGLTAEEREWGAKHYNQIKKVARHFYRGMNVIENGLGIERHYMRACHVLANMLGLNYDDEARLLAKRAFLADAFMKHGHEKAVALYEETYGEKYLGRDKE